ncbi:MAG: hypothetical protein ABJB09_00305 [Verrucomicrobiota bacterium]
MKIRVHPWLNFFGAISAGLIVVAFCLILLWHDPLLFWNDDYELSILPVFADVARSWSEGSWPLLSPYSWVCGNLAGEFQYGTFSVFVNAAVVTIWKFPLTFPQQAAALSMVHLFVLAMGGYFLARGRNLSAPLATMVALVAALNGWIICWGATDWFGALGAFAWLPWSWWALERALDASRSRWRFLWPAPFVYLLVTGGFPYTVLMLALLIAWLSVKSLGQTRKFLPIAPLVIGVALGFGLSAPAWLALFDYVHGSAREAQESSAHFQWVVPFAALPGFILPSWTVNWADFSTRLLPHTATEMACGLVPPIALLTGLMTRGRLLVRQIKWELGLLMAVLIIAMLPSANVFRWSFRWLPFLHVILALCASESLRLRLPARGNNASLFGVAAVAIIAGGSWLFHTGGEHAFPFIWISIGVATLWIALDFSRARSWAPAVVVFAALLATYLCIPPNCGVPKYNLSQDLLNPAPLNPARLYLSIHPPPESTYRVENKPEPVGQIIRPGSTSMWAGLRFINGYSPILAAGVAREFEFAIHGELDPEVQRKLLEEEAGPTGELALLGVSGIVVASEIDLKPQPENEWELTFSSGEGRVYHRLSAITSVGGISRNGMAVNVEVPPGQRPAVISFSRPFFRGYHATLEGHALEVSSYRGLFPIVEVPAGMRGLLILVYRPWWLVWGGGASIICAALWLAGVIAAALTRGRERLGSSLSCC